MIRVVVTQYVTRGVVALSAIAAAVALVACGLAGEREQAPEPLLIGQLNAITGSLSSSDSLRHAAVLAADHVNRAGGVAGAPVVVITTDTGADPARGVDAARALVDEQHAAVLLGARNSSVTIAVAEQVSVPRKRLQISSVSTSPMITGLPDDDFLFRTVVSDSAQGVVLARLAMEQGYERVAVMYFDNAYGQGLAAQFEATFGSLGGEVTSLVPHGDGQPTYVAELERAAMGDPDALVVISYPGQATIYLREALDGGFADTFLLVDATRSAEMIEAVGWDALEGVRGTSAGSPASAENRAFTAAYVEAHGASVPTHPLTAQTYDAAALIALAAAQAGSTTDPEAIRDALRSVANPPGEVVGPGVRGIAHALALVAEGKDINYEGASGPVDFDENGDVTGPIEVWKVEGGEIRSTGRLELP